MVAPKKKSSLVKSDHCEIIFILDATGSMKDLRTETVIGFNNFLEEQKKVPGEALLTLITFNSNETKKIYNHIDLKDCNNLELDQYVQMTGLLY